MMTKDIADAGAKHSKLTPEHKMVIWTLVAGIFIPLLDSTIVGVAVPRLAASFNAPIALLQWVATSYTLAAACAVPICAWASRRWGGRFIWITGLVVFSAGSAACGLSENIDSLIASRIVQGIGAGILMPVLQTILVHAVGAARLKTAMASAAVPTVLAPIVGPAIGAVLLHFGPWQLIFWINIPVAIFAIFLAFRFLQNHGAGAKLPFDFSGFLLLLPSLALMIWGFSEMTGMIGAIGHSALPAVGSVIAGTIFLVCFIVHALRRVAAPILDLALFNITSFRASLWLLFLSSMVFYGGIFLFPVFLIESGRFDPVAAALLVGFHGLGALLSRSCLEAATRRYGAGNTALLAVFGAGLGTVFLFIPDVIQVPVLVAAAMLIRGAGVGLLTLLALTYAYPDVARNRVADASSLSRVVILLGASVGTSAVAVLHKISLNFSWNGFTLSLVALLLPGIFSAIPALVFKRISLA